MVDLRRGMQIPCERRGLSSLGGKGDSSKEIQELTGLLKFVIISMADIMYQLAI